MIRVNEHYMELQVRKQKIIFKWCLFENYEMYFLNEDKILKWFIEQKSIKWTQLIKICEIESTRKLKDLKF